MVAGIAALKDKEHLKKTVDLIRTEKKWLYNQFDNLDVPYWPSQTNFIFIAPNIKDFTAQMLSEGIMVRPCDKFGAPNGIRITIGTHEANRALIAAIHKTYSYA